MRFIVTINFNTYGLQLMKNQDYSFFSFEN